MTKEERAAAVEQFRKARAELNALRHRHKTIGKQFFQDECKQLFADNPNLVDFGWVQYTPYFYDGEPCTFRCCKYDAAVNGVDHYGDYDSGDRSKYPALTDDDASKLSATVDRFLTAFEAEEFLDWFGDHVRVTVTKKGVEVDDYSHD